MTAPALPGAAPDPAPGRNDPARLPPEVVNEVALLFAKRRRVAPTMCGAHQPNPAEIKAAQEAVEIIAAHIAPPVAPTVEAALAALDVEAVDRKDSGVTVHEIVGLDDVRAAHRAEVDRLSARVAKLEAALTTAYDLVAEAIGTPQYDFRTRAKACVESSRAALGDKS